MELAGCTVCTVVLEERYSSTPLFSSTLCDVTDVPHPEPYFFFHFKRLSGDVPEAATRYRSPVLSDTFNVLFGHLEGLKSVGWSVIVVATTQQLKLVSKSNLWKHS